MVGRHPPGIRQLTLGAVSGGLEVLESPVQTDQAVSGEAVLGESSERIEEGFEVRLADQGGAIAGVVQFRGHRRGVDRQRDPVHPHAVGRRMLAGDHRRARRHAHHRLGRRPLVSVAGCGQPVDHRGARQRTTIAAEGVVALLIGGDEENLAAHHLSSSTFIAGGVSIWRFSSSSAPAVPPAIVKAIVRGSASVW